VSIELDNVTKSYPGQLVSAVEGFSMRVEPGELVTLVGPSGCGKTTTMKMTNRIIEPTSGSIRIDGRDVLSIDPNELRRHIGYVIQQIGLFPHMTIAENIGAVPKLLGWPKARTAERVEELLRTVELDPATFAQRYPRQLSGGQQQRVAIARALVHDPVLVLADEPTAHLDYIQVDGVIRLLRELAQPGRIVVVATHDDRMVPLADKVIELSAHAAPESGPPESVTVAAGRALFRQGDPGDRVYVVDGGEIELVQLLADGHEDLLAVAKPGDYFGELAPLFGLRRSATARARCDSTVTTYAIRDFRVLVHPGSVADLITRAADAQSDGNG
jgi:ABC-type proline/glycine betaine transport system ATPase subunit